MNLTKVNPLFIKVKERKPLIHHMTNAVTINDCANVTLAIGASPVMAMAIDEVEEIIQLADALVINLGTIHPIVFDSMLLAGRAANHKGIPVILDPVGAGATSFRTEKSAQFLDQVKVSVIRGNVSEIHALIGGESRTKGVEAGKVPASSIEIAIHAAKRFQCSVGVSGKEDVLSDGERIVLLQNGDEILTKVTGTGCMSTSLIGSFSAVTHNFFQAAVIGMSVMSLAGERAKLQMNPNDGIGTFKVKLIDEIDQMNERIFESEVRISEHRL